LGARNPTKRNHRVEDLETKLKEYERWFKVMDGQMRLLEIERQKLSAVVHNSDAAFVTFDRSLKVSWTNEAYGRKFRGAEGSANVAGQSCCQALCRQEQVCKGCPVVKALDTGEVSHLEIRREVDGHPRDIWATAMPIRTPDAGVTETIVMIQDVSDLEVLRRSQRALEASERKFRSIFEHAASGMTMVSVDGRFLEVNPAFCWFIGYSREELLGMKVFDITHPEDVERTTRAFGDASGSNWPTLARLEKRYMRKDGRMVWGNLTASWIFDDAGRPQYSVALCEDVTERKSAEEALLRSEARKGAILETALDSIVTIDHAGRILEFNPAAERTFGYARADAIGRKMAEMIMPERMRDRHAAAVRNLVEDGAKETLGRRMELTAVKADGTEFPVEMAITKILHEGPPLFTAYLRDLTDQKKAEAILREREEQLRQAQKMEAIGTLAGGLAHDFNNILAGIMGQAEMLRIASSGDRQIAKASDVIRNASRRGAELTRQLLGFARGGKQRNVPVDLHSTIKEVVDLLSRTIDKRIAIRADFRLKHAVTLGDPGQLQQVILNLALNAKDAMPGGGELLFRTDLADLDDKYCERNPGATPGRFVRVSVIDSGCGIPDEMKGRLFEPFFTTKEKGKGTGMGLAMVYGIVMNHGGSIQVSSRAGAGTTVSVNLVPTDREAEIDDAPSERKIVSGSGHILVVDDDETVRDVATGFLNHAGYDVLTASNGQEALDIYKREGHRIELVILDMVMPKMGGRECFRALKEMNSAIRVVLSTGHGFSVVAQEMLEEGMVGFVPKPYELSELTEAVAKALTR